MIVRTSMMSIAEILASINAWDLSAGFAVLSLTLIRPQITTCTVWDTLIHLCAWMIWYIYVYECFIIFVWIPTPAEPKSFVTNQFLMCHQNLGTRRPRSKSHLRCKSWLISRLPEAWNGVWQKLVQRPAPKTCWGRWLLITTSCVRWNPTGWMHSRSSWLTTCYLHNWLQYLYLFSCWTKEWCSK